MIENLKLNLIFLITFLVLIYSSPKSYSAVPLEVDIEKEDFQRQVFADSLNENKPKPSHTFYDSLRKKANRNKILSTLVNLALKKQLNKKADYYQFFKSQAQFNNYKNKIIRKIYINPAQVFDDSNPSNWEFINYAKSKLKLLHVRTKKSTIKKNLFFQEGEKLIPFVLAENKRYLNEMRFLEGVDFKINAVKQDSKIADSVDIIVTSHDVFCLGGGISFPGNSSLDLRMENINIFGTGAKISSTLQYDSQDQTHFKFVQGLFHLPNILNTFYDGELYYDIKDKSQIYRIKADKNLLPPVINTSGGFKFGRKYTDRQVKDSTLVIARSVKDFLNVGFGSSNPISEEENYSKRSYLSYQTSVYSQQFVDRPSVTADTNRLYHNRFGVLGSILLSRSEHYITREVFTFDKIEYVPSGFLLEFMAGPEFDEFYNRFYYGGRIARAGFIEKFGYYWGKMELGSYFYKGEEEQGVFNTKFKYCTPLIPLGRKEARCFFDIKYTRGINRSQEEILNINNENGIRGFNDADLYGNQRLVANFETALFAPWDLYGFHFAFFGFYDAGFIGEDIDVFDNNFESGFGLGLKIRNNYLAISFIQFRIGYHPQNESFSFSISGEDLPDLDFFDISYPEIIPFK
ncbi:MAG: hypothetical protein KGY75_08240 [Candidatus Cloacimonetes bacterium]|nr:hypothetical protein [Candidatus Cloacimonadota bacterium]